MNKPTLSKNIHVDDFLSYYWLKSELMDFCKKHKICQSGKKLEIIERIKIFLLHGKIVRSKPKILKKRIPPSLEKDITHFKCDLKHRKFFESIIGKHFRFNVHMIHFAKKHPHITYQTLIAEWEKEYIRKKDKSYKPPIQKSCEYNQFIRDFFSDSKRKNKSLKDAIEAWKSIKQRKGQRKYSLL